ncbi:MAG TPA: hypothetical protein VGT61_08000 [Thermomicrobiales bacterium]|jgi:hypothetical protein|nr:hypothetical protein [Thermomicrobiales bacterium]
MRHIPVPLPILAVALLLITILSLDGTVVAGQDAAAGSVSRAGIVVLHGDGSRTDAVVAFPGADVSGVELLRQSGIEVLAVPFGGLGEGICQIEQEGCEISECRRTVCQATRDAPYWQLFDRVAADGTWQSARLGASASRVRDGQVVVWAWTNDPIDLPRLDLPAVATAAGLDQEALETFGQDGPDAVVASGYTSPSAPVTSSAGLIGLLAIIVTGAVILLGRRLRMVR